MSRNESMVIDHNKLDIFDRSTAENQINRSSLKPINSIAMRMKSNCNAIPIESTIKPTELANRNNIRLHLLSLYKQSKTEQNDSIKSPDLETCFRRRPYLLSLYKESKSVPEQNKTLNHIRNQMYEDSRYQPANDCNAKLNPRNGLKITDLNDYCLQRIIRQLPLQDIINVAGTCKHLQASACEIFKLLLRNHEVIINCTQFPRYKIKSTKLAETFSGSDFSAFMIGFGEVIKQLTIVEMKGTMKKDKVQMEIDATIMKLIVKTCIMSVRSLNFSKCKEPILKNAQPFEMVTKVKFNECSFGKNDADFERFFPKLRKLEIYASNVLAVCDCISKSFPSLVYFHLYSPLNDITFTQSSFTMENIKTAIDLNPQLESVGLCYWYHSTYDATLLQYAAIHLPHLKSLQLWNLKYTNFREPIHFANVEKFTIINYNNDVERLDRNLNALSFPKLKKFNLNGIFNTQFLTFLARHKTITKLSIVNIESNDPSNDDVIRFGCILPNLKKIELRGRHLTPIGLIRFISQCKSISIVQVRHHVFAAIIRRLFRIECLKHGWKVTFNHSITEPEFVMKKL